MWLEPGRTKHGFLSSVGQSVRLLTSRSGVRASQGACCLTCHESTGASTKGRRKVIYVQKSA